MPPKWSLGYHQCRWSYASDKRVLEVCPFYLFWLMIYTHSLYSLFPFSYCKSVNATFSMHCVPLTMESYLLNLLIRGHLILQVARTFREKDIPCDVIWMDIDYMDGFRCFTFDKASRFSLSLCAVLLRDFIHSQPRLITLQVQGSKLFRLLHEADIDDGPQSPGLAHGSKKSFRLFVQSIWVVTLCTVYFLKRGVVEYSLRRAALFLHVCLQ